MSEVVEKGIIKQDITNSIEHEMAVYGYNINLMRMFPDVCDGYKPVQRRIIFEMGKSGLFHNKPFLKVMTISGLVCANTHPHGDVSVTDALCRMGQSFTMMCPTIFPKGNFGFLTGDDHAASRYIEGKLSEYGELFYNDINKNTVDWRKTYDNRSDEPVTLPAPLPNILINGAVGIGQGFSTSIPTHNLGEVIDLTMEFIKNPNLELEYLAKKIKPDFPTGGIITNSDDLYKSYMDPKSEITVKIRANIDITENDDLLIKDIPFMQTTGDILDKIQEKVNDKKITGISDIVDSTNKENGVKILIKVKRGTDPALLRNMLYDLTPLQSTFPINLMCTKNCEEFRFFNIKEILQEWLDYRRLNLKRMYNYDFSKLNREIHIIDGLLIALNNIDEIVALIKKSKDKQDIMNKLVKKYKLTKLQAENIAEMKLYKLSSLDQKSLKDKRKELDGERESLKEILGSDKKIDEIIISQLKDIKKKFAKPRKTVLENINSNITKEDLVSDDEYSFILTKMGFMKKLSLSELGTQNRGTKGRINKFKENDYAIKSNMGRNKDSLMFFTNLGRVITMKAYDIPETTLGKIGNDISLYVKLLENEKIITFIGLSNDDFANENGYFLITTEKGKCKKCSLSLFKNMTANKGIIACTLDSDDKIIDVSVVDETKDDKVMFFGSNGRAVTNSIKDIPTSLRTAMGSRCFKLKDNEKLVSVVVVSKKDTKNDAHIIVITKNGYGKATSTNEFSVINRNASAVGMLYIKFRDNDEVATVIKSPSEDTELTICSTKKIVKIKSSDVKPLLRPTMGYRMMNVDKDDFVTTMYLTI